MIPFRSKSSSSAQKSLERLNAPHSAFVCLPEEETMTRDEYEERLRALEAQVQADIALVQAGHEARVRSLGSLWQAATAGAAIPAPAPVPAVAPKKAARPDWSTLDDLQEALPRLPEVFDKRDVARVLGYAPAYTTLVRALAELKEAGEIADADGYGYRSQYRKVRHQGL